MMKLKRALWRNHSGNPDALWGFAPATEASPTAMTTYELQPYSGNRNALLPPTGDWRRKRGAIFKVKNGFSRAKNIGVYERSPPQGISGRRIAQE
jgi:hypothetical protein